MFSLMIPPCWGSIVLIVRRFQFLIRIAKRFLALDIIFDKSPRQFYVGFVGVQAPFPVEDRKKIRREERGGLVVVGDHAAGKVHVGDMVEGDGPARSQLEDVTISYGQNVPAYAVIGNEQSGPGMGYNRHVRMEDIFEKRDQPAQVGVLMMDNYVFDLFRVDHLPYFVQDHVSEDGVPRPRVKEYPLPAVDEQVGIIRKPGLIISKPHPPDIVGNFYRILVVKPVHSPLPP